MSAIFFLTTGEFLALFSKTPTPTEEQEQQQQQQAVAAAAEAAQYPPTEATQLLGMKPHPIPHHGIPTPAGAWQPHLHMGSPSRRLSSSLFDEEPLLRRLSLIVPKDEADTACCELEQHAASAGGSGGHVHPNHPHHAHHRPPGGSGDGAHGSGGGAGGGAAYATVI